jgi:hypothetical protein
VVSFLSYLNQNFELNKSICAMKVKFLKSHGSILILICDYVVLNQNLASKGLNIFVTPGHSSIMENTFWKWFTNSFNLT